VHHGELYLTAVRKFADLALNRNCEVDLLVELVDAGQRAPLDFDVLFEEAGHQLVVAPADLLGDQHVDVGVQHFLPVELEHLAQLVIHVFNVRTFVHDQPPLGHVVHLYRQLGQDVVSLLHQRVVVHIHIIYIIQI